MPSTDTDTADSATMRLDKWLWCARFYKTRAIAVEAISKGHVKVNQANAKPSKDVRAGDTVELKQGNIPKTVTIAAMASTRGSSYRTVTCSPSVGNGSRVTTASTRWPSNASSA